jgi:pimeloyl-ACP methyl ester carboxylesterase/DNA-binding winged helix-turn-helix (wHTH) protein
MRYVFGTCVLDTDRRELHVGAALVDVQPQVFDVLAHLLEHRDRVVRKEELLDAVWGTQFVTESALTTRIKQARQALGDDGRAQRMIRTVHGHGYRFVADVERVDGEVGEAAQDRPAGDRAAAAPTSAATAPPQVVEIERVPPTRYADSDGVSIAYQAFGDGPPLVLIAGFTTNVELQWEHPAIAAFLRRLASFSRVVVLDKRGVGLSDRMPLDAAPTLEERADDLRAVMDAAGFERATILGSSEGGALAMTFAAAHPERVERLVLHSTWIRHPHYPHERPDAEWAEKVWGQGEVYAALAPTIAATPTGRAFLARYERNSATPRTARLLRALTSRIDLTHVVPTIRVPTLVIHREDDSRYPLEIAQQIVEAIPGARLFSPPGHDHYLFSGDTTSMLDAIEEFVLGTKPSDPASTRMLATVLFCDIAGSTGLVRERGDRAWREVLDRFEALAGDFVARAGGELVAVTGDGFVAVFDGPARAIRAASGVRDGVTSLGVTVRCGIHTSEIERRGRDVSGVGVHVASRVEQVATPGTIWVTRTVTDLAAGSGLHFEPRGQHELPGFDEPWTLYEVA